MDDRADDLVLNGEDVIEITVVAFDPELSVARCVAELGRDSNAPPGPAHTGVALSAVVGALLPAAPSDATGQSGSLAHGKRRRAQLLERRLGTVVRLVDQRVGANNSV